MFALYVHFDYPDSFGYSEYCETLINHDGYPHDIVVVPGFTL